MGQKFRSSLFGFNKDDVLTFAITSKEKEKELKSRLDRAELKQAETEEKLTTVTDELSAALKEIDKLSDEVKAYREREDEITKLSESIGRLYLVAKTNARTVTEMAEASVKASSELVDRNIEIAENTENGMEEIKTSFKERSDELISEIEKLKAEISEIKLRTVTEREKSNEYLSETENIIKSIGAKLDE